MHWDHAKGTKNEPDGSGGEKERQEKQGPLRKVVKLGLEAGNNIEQNRCWSGGLMLHTDKLFPSLPPFFLGRFVGCDYK